MITALMMIMMLQGVELMTALMVMVMVITVTIMTMSTAIMVCTCICLLELWLFCLRVVSPTVCLPTSSQFANVQYVSSPTS